MCLIFNELIHIGFSHVSEHITDAGTLVKRQRKEKVRACERESPCHARCSLLKPLVSQAHFVRPLSALWEWNRRGRRVPEFLPQQYF